MTLRIGLIGYALDRAAGGIGRYSRELLAALANQPIDLSVLQAGCSTLPVKSIHLPGAALLPGLLTLGQFEIAWITRQRHLDLLHDPTGSLPIAFAPARRVATIHDVIPYIYPETSTTLDRLIYHLWLPLSVRRMDAIITDSQQSKMDLEKHLPVEPSTVKVIPAAARPAYRPLSRQEILPALQRAGLEPDYILYVGSLEPRKNLLRLLDAYAQLRRWSTRWPLVIVGARNFWKSSPVIEKVEKLGLKSAVIFTGFIPEEDLPAIYNGAKLFVFPSLYEGFGLPVLEAMACGVPVITSNTSSLPEVAGQAALLIDPYAVEQLAAAMQRVLSESALAEDLRRRGLEQASQFTWERTARETVAVYESVLSSKDHSSNA